MFFKNLKYIDGRPFLCTKLNTSEKFMVLFSEQVVLVEKEAFVEYFTKFRRAFAKTHQYSLTEPLHSYQVIDEAVNEYTLFLSQIMHVTVYQETETEDEPVIVQAKKRKIVVKRIKKNIQGCYGIQTEVMGFVSQTRVTFYAQLKNKFERCLQFECEHADQAYLNQNGVMYLLSHNTVHIYHLELKLPHNHSSFSQQRKVDFSFLQQNIRFISHINSTLFGEQDVFAFNITNEKFSLQRKYKIIEQWKKQDLSYDEHRVLNPEMYQLVEVKGLGVFTLPQKNQSIFLYRQGTVEQFDINIRISAIAISIHEYYEWQDDYEYQKPTSPSYNIIAFITQYTNEVYFFKILPDKPIRYLFRIIDTPHTIEQLHFITPYDVAFVDSANYVGIIQLAVKDMGVVCI